MKPEHLEAERLVAAARTAVERQRELIGQLVNDGYKTGEALGAAQSLDLSLLYRPQQFYLRLRRQVADLVKEKGPAMGLLEPALPKLFRTRKRSPLVAE